MRVEARRAEDRQLAETAVEWLHRLETAGVEERAKFLHWLKESPWNIREVLIAATWDSALKNVDSRRKLDIAEIVSRRSTVTYLQEQPAE